MNIRHRIVLILIIVISIIQQSSTSIFASSKTNAKTKSAPITEEQIVTKKFKTLIAKFDEFFKSKPKALYNSVSKYWDKYEARMYQLHEITYYSGN